MHIIENHNDMADYYDIVLQTVENPDIIFKNYNNALLAGRKHRNKYVMVVYKELTEKDGFIITAYMTCKLRMREVLWQKTN